MTAAHAVVARSDGAEFPAWLRSFGYDRRWIAVYGAGEAHDRFVCVSGAFEGIAKLQGLAASA
jgi:hypothetical protein